MYIKKIVIQNFKCFSKFSMDVNEKVNILVGDNNEGKSTILEAINLCLTGFFRGRYFRNNRSNSNGHNY